MQPQLKVIPWWQLSVNCFLLFFFFFYQFLPFRTLINALPLLLSCRSSFIITVSEITTLPAKMVGFFFFFFDNFWHTPTASKILLLKVNLQFSVLSFYKGCTYFLSGISTWSRLLTTNASFFLSFVDHRLDTLLDILLRH